jgi:hypothetical protein
MTQQTAIRRLTAALAWTRHITHDDDFMQRSIRAIENNIDDVFDYQHISHAAGALALLRTGYEFSSILRILWLKEVVETCYGGVTDIFHDDLVQFFSCYLYESFYKALEEFEQQRG